MYLATRLHPPVNLNLRYLLINLIFQGRRGTQVPPKLRALARVLAVITRYKYPNTDEDLKLLNKGKYQSEAKDSYQYNIKSYQNRVQTKNTQAKSMRRMSIDLTENMVPNSLEQSEEKRFKFIRTQIDYFKDKFKRKQKTKLLEDDDMSFNEQFDDIERKQEAQNRWKKGIGKAVDNVKRKRNIDESWANLIQNLLVEN